MNNSYFFILILTLCFFTNKIKAQTEINGQIITDSTLTIIGSPYKLISNLYIEGSTLTIEPSVTVNLNGHAMYIGYSSSYDPSVLEADGVDFENGSIIVGYYNGNGSDVMITNSNLDNTRVSIYGGSDSTVSDNDFFNISSAISVSENSNVDITGNTINASDYGINVDPSSTATISGNEIIGASNYAIGLGNGIVSNNIIADCGYIYSVGFGSTPQFSNNTFNNSLERIRLTGNLINTNATLMNYGYSYDLISNSYIEGSTLTIEPSVTVNLNGHAMYIGYSSSYDPSVLEADGVDFENGSIIVGYYNGNGSDVMITNSNLDNTRVSIYGGSDSTVSDNDFFNISSAISVSENSNVDITGNTINASDYGINVDPSSTATISGNEIIGASNYAIGLGNGIVSNNIIADCGYIYSVGFGSTPQFSNNTFNNSLERIRLTGNLINTNATLMNYGYSYDLISNSYIEGSTLTIEPSVTVNLNGHAMYIGYSSSYGPSVLEADGVDFENGSIIVGYYNGNGSDVMITNSNLDNTRVSIYGGSDSTVSDNDFFNISSAISVSENSNVDITGNTINASDYGINVDPSSTATISGNEIIGASNYAIGLGNGIVSNNIIADCGYIYSVGFGSTPQFSNNTFNNSLERIRLTGNLINTNATLMNYGYSYDLISNSYIEGSTLTIEPSVTVNLNGHAMYIGYSSSYDPSVLEADGVDFENGSIIVGYYNGNGSDVMITNSNLDNTRVSIYGGSDSTVSDNDFFNISSAISVSENSNVDITGNTINASDYGINVDPSSTATISGNEIIGASNYAIGLGNGIVSNNIIADCGYIYSVGFGSTPQFSNNTFNNSLERIRLTGNLINTNATLMNYGYSYDLISNSYIEGSTLTIEPSVTVNLNGHAMYIGYSSSYGPSVLEADGVDFENGSIIVGYYNGNGSEIMITNCNLDDTKISIYNSGPNSSIMDCDFKNISGYAINSSAGIPINAINNYWGDPSGPTHTTNPGGSGYQVSDNVDFDPWAMTPHNPYYSGVTTVFNVRSGGLYQGQSPEVELQLNGLKIAADGSSTTMFKYTSADLTDIGFRLKDIIVSDASKYGIFASGNINGTTLEVVYTHPEYFSEPDVEYPNWKYKDFTVQVYNTQTDDVLEEYPIKIVRPSVLMVHGLWGNLESFESMQGDLLDQGMYDGYQLLKMLYTADIPNEDNAPLFELFKNTLKNDAISHNISNGKIDVLAHSNGGLLSRYHIQSNRYSGDINKLITYNTPHSGSQVADLLLSNSYGWLRVTMGTLGMNCINGLVDNQRVGGGFIQDLNMSSEQFSQIYGEIGLHTMSSTETLNNMLNESSWDALLMRKLKYVKGGAAGLQLFLNNEVFNNPDPNPNHDIIVSEESQIGGVSATSDSENQYHVGSTRNSLFQAKTIELLNQNPNSPSYFSLNGYAPVQLSPNLNRGPETPAINILEPETITIVSPVPGASFMAGETISIEVNGSTGIENIVTSLGNAITSIQSHSTENASSDTFNLTIPSDALGRLELVTVGFDANGFADDEASYIMVTTAAGLDSLEIVQQSLYIPQGRTSEITILGHYDDGETRNVTHQEGLIHQFVSDNATLLENGMVTGVAEGVDILIVSYLDKTASVPITIANAEEWQELRLKLNKKVLLQGPFNSDTGLMDDTLRSSGLIPITSPYADAQTLDSAVLNSGGATGNGSPEDDIVDWVWVELRDKIDNTSVVASTSALIQRDGDVVDINGISEPKLNAYTDSYFVAVNHRNHLGTISANTIALNKSTATSIDFTDSSFSTYGNHAQVPLGSGDMALWAGDTNGDGIIQYAGAGTLDTSALLAFILNDDTNFLNLPTWEVFGYNNFDVDMSGSTQFAGAGELDTPFILQNILSYQGNFLGLSTWQIIEQIPNN